MNPLPKLFSLVATGILAAALTAAPVNADAAGRESAGATGKIPEIPACVADRNAPGGIRSARNVRKPSGREAIAAAFGRTVDVPVREGRNENFDAMELCDDKGVLRFVPPLMDRRLLQLEKNLFRHSRWVFSAIQADENAGMILHIETTPADQAVNLQKAALYADTIGASRWFQDTVRFVNTKHGPGTIPDNIVTVIYVGPEDTLDDPPLEIYYGPLDVGELWDMEIDRTGGKTDPQQVAEGMKKIAEGYLKQLEYRELITEQERGQLLKKFLPTAHSLLRQHTLTKVTALQQTLSKQVPQPILETRK